MKHKWELQVSGATKTQQWRNKIPVVGMNICSWQDEAEPMDDWQKHDSTVTQEQRVCDALFCRASSRTTSCAVFQF